MRGRRPGYTLLELVIAVSSAAVLVAGLSGALLVSSRALDIDEGAAGRRATADARLATVLADVQSARRIIARSATSIDLETPDRTGDGNPDFVTYSWSGVSGDPLQRTINRGDAVDLISDVRSLDFSYLEQVVTAQDVTAPIDPAAPVFESVSFDTIETAGVMLDLQTPSGTADGELLLAGVAVEGDRSAEFVAPAGWTPLSVAPQGDGVTLAISWKIAAAEPASHTWSWGTPSSAVGWVIRISNQSGTAPIHGVVSSGNQGAAATAPAAPSTVDHTLVIRMAGVEADGLDEDGLPAGHTGIFGGDADEAVSGGCAHRTQTAAGDSGEAAFLLDGNVRHRTVTIHVAPEEDTP